MARVISSNDVGKIILKRSSNFELLRIVCMLFIIAEHLAIGAPYATMKYWSFLLFKSFTIVAVNVYVLISGYWSIRFSFKKILRLCTDVLFYSLIYSIYLIITNRFEIRSSIKYLLPVTSNILWFVGSYLILCFVSPILNHVVADISKKQFQVVLLLAFILFYVWPSVSFIFNFDQVVKDAGYGPINFIILYLFGRYIFKYVATNEIDQKRPLFWITCYALNSLLLFGFQAIYSLALGFSFTSLLSYNSVFVLAGALFLFMAFKNIDFKSAIINVLAKNCFSVYIIHMLFPIIMIIVDHFHLISDVVLLPAIISISVIIYLVCISVDYIRKCIFERIQIRIIDIVSGISLFQQIEKSLLSIEKSKSVV